LGVAWEGSMSAIALNSRFNIIPTTLAVATKAVAACGDRMERAADGSYSMLDGSGAVRSEVCALQGLLMTWAHCPISACPPQNLLRPKCLLRHCLLWLPAHSVRDGGVAERVCRPALLAGAQKGPLSL
jgi:hypothetical protein